MIGFGEIIGLLGEKLAFYKNPFAVNGTVI